MSTTPMTAERLAEIRRWVERFFYADDPLGGEVVELLAEVDRLRDELIVALEEMEDMVPYVGPYFREKWGYDHSIARVKAALGPVTKERTT